MPHILLIEDNPGDALLLREMYNDADNTGEDYTITHVTRVKQAIELLQTEHSFDLILSDISLPDSQGIETLEALKQIASELPVIFMTGTNNDALVSRAIKAGAQDYLVKGHIDAQVVSRATLYAIERKKAQISIERAVRHSDILRQQKRQLMALNNAKDDFISLSSHQLRTPATSVKQYLGMVLEGYAGEVPENIRVYIKTAYDSNEQQLTIINDLLKTAQIDSGRYTLKKEMFDVCSMVEEVIGEYKPIFELRQQHIVFHGTDNCEAAYDQGELRIAISNLLENASKYSEAGSTITVTLHRTNHHLIISVADEGVGIDPDDTEKIFDRFTRIDNRLSDTVSGSGLGLYFVKRIVRMHGGSISLKTAPNKGSDFTISLPI